MLTWAILRPSGDTVRVELGEEPAAIEDVERFTKALERILAEPDVRRVVLDGPGIAEPPPLLEAVAQAVIAQGTASGVEVIVELPEERAERGLRDPS
jgi:hypothetical protein